MLSLDARAAIAARARQLANSIRRSKPDLPLAMSANLATSRRGCNRLATA